MTGAASVPDARLIDTASAKRAIYDALRLQITYGHEVRAMSQEDVSMALRAAGHDVTRDAVGAWVSRSEENRRTPPAPVLLMLCHMFGPAFTNKVLGAIGQGAYGLTSQSLLPPQVIAVLSEGLSEFAVRGVDGVYCNVDQGVLERFADRMIEVLTPFSTKTKGC